MSQTKAKKSAARKSSSNTNNSKQKIKKQRFYAIRSCASLQSPAVFTNEEDCSFYIDDKNQGGDADDHDPPAVYQVFDSMLEAVDYLGYTSNNPNTNTTTDAKEETENDDKPKKKSSEFKTFTTLDEAVQYLGTTTNNQKPTSAAKDGENKQTSTPTNTTTTTTTTAATTTTANNKETSVYSVSFPKPPANLSLEQREVDGQVVVKEGLEQDSKTISKGDQVMALVNTIPTRNKSVEEVVAAIQAADRPLSLLFQRRRQKNKPKRSILRCVCARKRSFARIRVTSPHGSRLKSVFFDVCYKMNTDGETSIDNNKRISVFA